MDKTSLKDVLYGGVSELMNNRLYYRKSTIDPKYSDWQEEGKIALLSFIEFVAHEIQAAEEIEIKKKAKELTIDALTGKNI